MTLVYYVAISIPTMKYYNVCCRETRQDSSELSSTNSPVPFICKAFHFQSIFCLYYLILFFSISMRKDRRQQHGEMPSSVKITATFSNKDGREIIKKEMCQKVLSVLMPPLFGILLADTWEYQRLEIMQCARASPHSAPVSHQSHKSLGSMAFMMKLNIRHFFISSL